MGLINLLHKGQLLRLYQRATKTPAVMQTPEFWLQVYRTACGIKEIRDMVNKVQGYKTYGMAAGAALVLVAQMTGYLTPEQAQPLLMLFGAGGAVTLAAKVNRVEKKL